MSKAFTNEETAPEPLLVPARSPLPPGVTNYVTARGLELLKAERQRLELGRAELDGIADDAERTLALAASAARLAELDQRLASATLVDPALIGSDVVRFGSKVTVRDAEGRERRYEIVGVDEADPEAGRLAFLAPLARALLGARVGDDVSFKTPARSQELSVLAIE
jgi:transcription elongation factor GreB